MLEKQSSNEKLSLRREDNGRGIKLLKDIYKETRLRIACYIACSENKWISAAWRRENTKWEDSVVQEEAKPMDKVEVEIRFEEGNNWINGELINAGWKPVWNRLKEK